MRDVDKDGDVMCWNCFTVEDVDNDIEPITLKKVRIQQREKLKVYPFLASELSKPKAVALKQKLSSHYQIAKKNSEKIHKIPELHSDGKDTEPQEDDKLKQEDKNISDEEYVPPLESKLCQNDNDKNISEDNINESIKIQSNHFVVDNVTVKRNTEDVNDVITKNTCDVGNASTSVIVKETAHRNFKSVISINQSVTSETENYNTENENTQIDSPSHNTEYKVEPAPTITKIEGTDKNTNVPCTETVKYDIDSDGENLQRTTTHNTSDKVDAVSNVNQRHVVIKTPPRSPQMSRIPLSIERLTPESNKKILKTRNSFEGLKPPEITSTSKELKNVQIKNSSPKLDKIASDTNVKKRSESFLKYLGLSKKKYQEPSKIKKDTPSTSIEDKIKNINFKMPTSETSNEDSIADDESKEKVMAQSIEEVVDKNSTTNSESGYAGSSGTLQNLDATNENTDKSLGLRTKSVEVIKLADDDTITVRRDEKVFTSLSSLSNIPKLSSLSKSSTITPIKKPLKSLRWSTLSVPARKFSFEDDIYVSDASTPHHGATLPRRSNSPLPHDRDFDRERFPINRSGLQARSESMASVYSGAGEARGGVAVRGEVQFSLLYNYRLGALEVRVRACRDLAPVDVKRNRSDPYVKVYLLPDKSKSGKRKTKVRKNTLSPVFEETLSFSQPLAAVAARTVWLSVWHADMFGRNDFLGEVRLPLADVVFDDPTPVWYKLHERTEQFDEQQGSRGDLIVGLKLETTDPRGKGTLRVLVKEAKNLVATKPNGLADVFCKSYLLPERGRLGKQKTGVCRRSLSPRWDHELLYRGVSAQQLAARALELSLWDRDRLASNDFMGAVRLSLGTGTYMGATVNWMDSVGKEVTLWQTMLDRPNFWVEGSLPLRPQLNN